MPPPDFRTRRAPALRAILSLVGLALIILWQWQSHSTPATTSEPPIAHATSAAPSTPGGSSGTEATLARSTADAGPSQDLSVDEQRGGHTLSRHVARTDAQLLERLATRIAEACRADDRVSGVVVTVRKLEPPMALELDHDRMLLRLCTAMGIESEPERFGNPLVERERLEQRLREAGVDFRTLDDNRRMRVA